MEALARHFDHGERLTLRALAALPHGHLHARRGAGQRSRLPRLGRDLRRGFVVDLRDNPDQDRGPANLSRDGAMIAAQMVLMNLADAGGAANAGHFRPLTVLTRPGSVFDPRAGRRVRRLLRGADPPLRPDPALPGAAPRRAVAGGRLHLDLRDVHRRPAPGHRPALHDRRAGGRRLGRLCRTGRTTVRSSAPSTATRSTARPRWPRRATASTSTSSS